MYIVEFQADMARRPRANKRNQPMYSRLRDNVRIHNAHTHTHAYITHH